ncbi:MAG: hypothetical protein QM638_04795 [Nocardioides sp.]|uniref:hypothetical protein n=1 Tax=Nocardioides sp. TaxID=35761 RepID=UPI0039E3CD25
MEQALTLGSLLPAAVGAGCCAAGPRARDLGALAAMALMLAGMLDIMVFGSVLLPSGAWAVVFAGLALAMLALEWRTRLGLARALHLGVMALLTAAMAGDSMPDMSGGTGMSGMSATADRPGLFTAAVVLVAVGYAAYAAWRAFVGRGGARVELLAGGLSVLAMAGMVVR